MSNDASAETDERTEVKFAVVADSISAALKAFGLARPADEHRNIYFFDTLDLKLDSQGLILRLRQGTDGGTPDDVTVKLRAPRNSPTASSDIASLAARWQAKLDAGGLESAKLEADETVGAQPVQSFSITSRPANDVISKVVRKDQPLRIAFGTVQTAFLSEQFSAGFDAPFVQMGPVPAQVWKKIKESTVSNKLTAELWTVGARQFLELSAKVPSGNAEEFSKELDALMKAKGFLPEQEMKTAFVLSHFRS